MLASRRNIVGVEAERMGRRKRPYTLSHRLRGSTLGIFGLGNIGGSLVAQAGAGLGMNVIPVWGQERSFQHAAASLNYGIADSKAALFEQSDVLSLHVRSRPPRYSRYRRSRGLSHGENHGADRQHVPCRAHFSLEALLAALRAGRPGYAAVDVYEQEPVLRGDHPFLSMPNVVCTPHLGWAEWDNFELYYAEAFEQIVAYERGLPLRMRQSRCPATPLAPGIALCEQSSITAGSHPRAAHAAAVGCTPRRCGLRICLREGRQAPTRVLLDHSIFMSHCIAHRAAIAGACEIRRNITPSSDLVPQRHISQSGARTITWWSGWRRRSKDLRRDEWPALFFSE